MNKRKFHLETGVWLKWSFELAGDYKQTFSLAINSHKEDRRAKGTWKVFLMGKCWNVLCHRILGPRKVHLILPVSEKCGFSIEWPLSLHAGEEWHSKGTEVIYKVLKYSHVVSWGFYYQYTWCQCHFNFLPYTINSPQITVSRAAVAAVAALRKLTDCSTSPQTYWWESLWVHRRNLYF